jgi:hypothetical protein
MPGVRRRQPQTLPLAAVANGVEADGDDQPSTRCAQRSDAAEHGRVAAGHGLQQAAPGELHVHLDGQAVEHIRQRGGCGAQKQCVRRAAARGSAVYALGQAGERIDAGVDTDHQRVWIAPGALIDVVTIAGAHIDDDTRYVGRDQRLEVTRVESSNGAAANSIQHGCHDPNRNGAAMIARFTDTVQWFAHSSVLCRYSQRSSMTQAPQRGLRATQT